MEETNANESKQLALAAVMFFGLLVKNFVQNNKNEFSETELQYIESYIHYGYITMISGIFTIICIVLYYIYPTMIFYRLHTIAIAVSIILLTIGTIGALSESIIIHNSKIVYTKTNIDASSVIMYYMPIYNIFLRYKEHNFITPNIYLKESIVVRSLRSILGLITQSQSLLIICFLIILARIVSVASGIDISNKKYKQSIHAIFQVNPEEWRAYIVGSIEYYIQQIQHKIQQLSRKECIQKHKKIYRSLEEISISVWIQYAIWIVLLIRWWIHIPQTLYTWIVYVPALYVIWRYIIMYYKRKHLPSLPLAREIKWWLYMCYEGIKTLFTHVKDKS